jgi:hypothetical protein
MTRDPVNGSSWRDSGLPRCPHSGRDQVQSGPGIMRHATSWHWLGFVILPHKFSTSLLFENGKISKKISAQSWNAPRYEYRFPLGPAENNKEFFESGHATIVARQAVVVKFARDFMVVSGDLRLPVEQAIASASGGACYPGETTAMQGVGSRRYTCGLTGHTISASGIETIIASGPSASVRRKSTPFRSGFSVYYPYGKLNRK